MAKTKQKETEQEKALRLEVETILNLLDKRQKQTPIQTLVQQHGVSPAYLTRHVTRMPLHFLAQHADELHKAAKHMGMSIESLAIVAIRDFMKRQRLQPVPFEGSKGAKSFDESLRSEVAETLACEYEE